MSSSIKYLLNRLGIYCIAGWAAITLNFFIPRLMPGDPVSVMFASFRGKLKPEAMEALKQTFGFTDEPLVNKYITYLKHLFSGDLGISTAYFPEKVSSIIMSGLSWTACTRRHFPASFFYDRYRPRYDNCLEKGWEARFNYTTSIFIYKFISIFFYCYDSFILFRL